MMTTSTAAGYESDISGLICAFRFTPDGSGAELDPQTLEQRLADSASESEEGDFLWLHMNLSQAGCVRWLRAHLELPDAFIAMLGEAAHSTRIEQQERALVAVFNDVIFDFERTPAQVATLWVCARRKLLVTLRHKPLRSLDRLREHVRRGERFRSPAELLAHLMRDQADLMTEIVRKASLDVDGIEDRFLAAHAGRRGWTWRQRAGCWCGCSARWPRAGLGVPPAGTSAGLAAAARRAGAAGVDGRILRRAGRHGGPDRAHQAAAGRDRGAPAGTEQPHAVHPDAGHGAGPAHQHHGRPVRHERGRHPAGGGPWRLLDHLRAGGGLHRGGGLVAHRRRLR